MKGMVKKGTIRFILVNSGKNSAKLIITVDTRGVILCHVSVIDLTKDQTMPTSSYNRITEEGKVIHFMTK
jgi:hypothetical protein